MEIDNDKLYKLKKTLGHARQGGIIIGSGLRELLIAQEVLLEFAHEYAQCIE